MVIFVVMAVLGMGVALFLFGGTMVAGYRQRTQGGLWVVAAIIGLIGIAIIHNFS